MTSSARGERVDWVDAMRFLGILAIYVGHFNTAAGRLLGFVFLYHVPLFFFAAGFFAQGRDVPLGSVFRRLVRRLLAPYVFFALLALVVMALAANWGWPEIRVGLMGFLRGVRNQMPAGTLWFFPCLFVVQLMHAMLLRILPGAVWPVVVGFAGLMVAQHAMPFNPLQAPRWVFGVDSAIGYLFWFALGHALYPALRAMVQQRHAGFRFAVGAAIVVAAGVYLHGPDRLLVWSLRLPLSLGGQHLGPSLVLVLLVMVLLLAQVGLALWLARVPAVRDLGSRTLVLCGTEEVIKLVLAQGLLLLGLGLQLPSPLAVLLFSLVCLCVAGWGLGRLLERHAPGWSGLRRATVSA